MQLYATKVFKKIGSDGELINLVMGTVSVLSCFLQIYLSKKLGRKLCFLIGLILQIIGLTLMVI